MVSVLFLYYYVLAEAEYDNLGKVTKYIDNETEKVYTYIYDEIGNVEKEYINGVLFKEYKYDSHSRLTNTATCKKPKDEL